MDFLSKKRVKNNGHAAQYYVEDSHPPIISKEEFAAVQLEFERRTNLRGYSKTGKSKFTSDYAFSGKLFCGNCGSKFRRTKWGRGKNQQILWICINHQITGACDMKSVKEKALEQAFLRVMNRLIGSKGALLSERDGNDVGQSANEDVECEWVWRDRKREEFKAYLSTQGSLLDKFDEDLFQRLIEKVKIQSMVEAVFVFRAGNEVREIL